MRAAADRPFCLQGAERKESPPFYPVEIKGKSYDTEWFENIRACDDFAWENRKRVFADLIGGKFMTDSRTVLIDKQEDRDMQLRDHRILAVFLIDKMGRSMSFFYRRMFILGSLEPDRKPFTYLHGITKGDITMRIFCR